MSAFDGKIEELELDTWGTKGYLTMEQSEALIQFMSTAKESDLSVAKFATEPLENVSLRFLRARQFSVVNALELLKKCVERKTTGQAKHFATLTPDEVVKCDMEMLKKFYPHSHLGYDKLNRPILFEQSGQINPTAITSMTTFGALVDYHFHTMEKDLSDIFERATADGKPAVYSTCAILDLEGLSMVHCTGSSFEHMKSLVALDNVCYPETLGKMLVINAPWLAVTTWEIVKGWLDPRTQAKIEILGAGPETSAKLLKYIDASVLPKKYGGKAPDWTSSRPLAEYLSLGRSGDARREISVPAGHTLYVESYVPEGEVFVEVYVSPMKFDDGVESSSGKSTSSTSSTKKLDSLIQLSRTQLLGSGANPPVRNKQEFPNPTNDNMYFVLRWVNTAMLVGRSVVANVYTQADPTLQT